MIPANIQLDYRFVLAAGGLLLFFYWYAKREVAAGVRAVGTAVNPLSDRNLVYRSISATGEALSGRKDWSLGSALYDWLNQDANLTSDRRARELLRERRAYNYGVVVSPIQPVDKPTAYLN